MTARTTRCNHLRVADAEDVRAPPTGVPRVRWARAGRATSSAQEAWFEVLVPARAESLRADLDALDPSLDAGTTDSTRVLLGAGLLASNGLMHDARRRVLDALAAAPDEPALYQALGTIYDRAGLPPQATTAFQEAQLLLDGGRPAAPVFTPR